MCSDGCWKSQFPREDDPDMGPDNGEAHSLKYHQATNCDSAALILLYVFNLILMGY